MRLAALTISTLVAALAGCQATPDLAALPHATVAGTHVDVDGDRVDTFRVLAIDGRNVLPATDQPVKLIRHDATDVVAAGHGVRLEVEGFAFYDSTGHRMFWSPMRAHGVVEFVPAADAKYSLHGSVTPTLSSVWVENDATHDVVGNRISVAISPSESGSNVQTMRSGGA
jgi:hypothetical protein